MYVLKIMRYCSRAVQNGYYAFCVPYWVDICIYLLNWHVSGFHIIIQSLAGDKSHFPEVLSAIFGFSLLDSYNHSSHFTLWSVFIIFVCSSLFGFPDSKVRSKNLLFGLALYLLHMGPLHPCDIPQECSWYQRREVSPLKSPWKADKYSWATVLLTAWTHQWTRHRGLLSVRICNISQFKETKKYELYKYDGSHLGRIHSSIKQQYLIFPALPQLENDKVRKWILLMVIWNKLYHN